jgi:hypothetical protein
MSKKLGESEKLYILRKMERQENRKKKKKGKREVLKRWNEIKEWKQQNRRRRLNEYQRQGEGADALTTALSTSFCQILLVFN